MGEKLIKALDVAAKRSGRDRSKIVREAVARFLAGEEARDKEAQTIAAYGKHPMTREERAWLKTRPWPKT